MKTAGEKKGNVKKRKINRQAFHKNPVIPPRACHNVKSYKYFDQDVTTGSRSTKPLRPRNESVIGNILCLSLCTIKCSTVLHCCLISPLYKYKLMCWQWKNKFQGKLTFAFTFWHSRRNKTNSAHFQLCFLCISIHCML